MPITLEVGTVCSRFPWDSSCQSLDRMVYSRDVPKAASDSLLTCTVVPTPNQREKELETVRQDVANGAVLWDVNVSEMNERFTVQPDPHWPGNSDPPPDYERPELAPYIEADFTVLQHNGQLTVVSWSISGTEIVSTRKSRIPLQAYARAALIAVEDALHANAEHSYEQMMAERRGHASFLEMSNGRLIDPKTRESRKPAPRPRLVASNGKPIGLAPSDVADAYRMAVKSGSRSPTVDVAHAFHVGRSTAARAIAEARKQGLLGPALRNAAGEQT